MTLNARPDKHLILIVDDEPDILVVTRLSLKGLRYRDCPLELLSAASGEEAVAVMKANPDIAVILLDVVMETNSAGLDACATIREELGNRHVRILLRTGQPGVAPEKEAIDKYDIDGYLPKAELTSHRVYAAVRTAIKAWEELVELDRHGRYLTALHDCVSSLHSFGSLDETLERILETAVEIYPTDLAVLHLETFVGKGNPQKCVLHLSTDTDDARSEGRVAEVTKKLGRSLDTDTEPTAIDSGMVVPLRLHRELGRGWIYLEGVDVDEVTRKVLPILASHAANALYSVVAHGMLSDREGPIYDSMII